MASQGPPAWGDPWTSHAQPGAGLGGGRAGPPSAVRSVGGLGNSVVAAAGGSSRAATQDTAAASAATAAAAAAAAAADASAAPASVNGASYGIHSLSLDDSRYAGRTSLAEPPPLSPPLYLSPSSAQIPRRNLPPPSLPPPPQVSASISGPCLSHFLADLSLTDSNAHSWDSPDPRSFHHQQDGLQERARGHQVVASTSLAGATGDSEGLLFGSVSFDKIAQVLQDDVGSVPSFPSSSSNFMEDSSAGLRSHAGGNVEGVQISVVIQQFCTAQGGMATEFRAEKAVHGALHEAKVPTAAAAQTERTAAPAAAAGSGRLFDAAGVVDGRAVSSLLASVARGLDGGSPGPSGRRERLGSLEGSLRDAGAHPGPNSLRDGGNASEPRGHGELSEESETRSPVPTSSVVGWFVRRRKSPVRPSMREVAATASLHRWLRHQRLCEKAGAGNQGQGRGMARSQPLLLLIASSTSSAARTSSPGQPGPIHSYDYQLYMFDPHWRARQRAAFAAAAALADAGGRGSASLPSHSPLRAIPLQIANLGSLMRPHYDPLPSLSFLPFAPLVATHALVPGQALHPRAAGAAQIMAATSSGWQAGLAAAASVSMQQVEGLEAIYHGLLQQLNLLAEELATTEASIVEVVERTW